MDQIDYDLSVDGSELPAGVVDGLGFGTYVFITAVYG